MHRVASYIAGAWIAAGEGARPIADAVTGEIYAEAGGGAVDCAAMLGFAKEHGGPALRAMTFHQRAKMLKALARWLHERREVLYELSYRTGGTLADHRIDVDGGIGTVFVYASKGRREMPDDVVLSDGPVEQLGRTGAFLGQHVYTARRGVAVHINAFNFPVWGMLEKLAPALLAGMPSVVKPATVTCPVTELCVRMILDSGILPVGALQLVTGGLGDTLERLDCQDNVTFTGSADTALMLRQTPALVRNGVPFTAEQDSLNASVLGPDAGPDSPEFEAFVKEACREMTAKAGQKCTAIRRIMAPEGMVEPLLAALSARLGKIVVGDPRAEGVHMGPLVSLDQRADVQQKAAMIGAEAELIHGAPEGVAPQGADGDKGAFMAPMLFHCADPDAATALHTTEAFGPVSTVMAYRDLGHALALANRGQGSLVASVVTHDPQVAREAVLEAGAFHGRLYFTDRDAMAEATGHGAPMPHMVHGGPGRAGGGEELGGIRGVKHFMQRTAVQGSPAHLSAVTGRYIPGAPQREAHSHPFTRRFGDLAPGDVLHTAAREVSLDDIEHFAQFTGDTFYAHMDEAAAQRNPFFPGRVAHGYLLLSFAAGLFVEPSEGPVLANTGLDGLRFMKPVSPGDRVKVDLTVMHKTPRTADYGEVRWHVRMTNQDDEQVAEYELLTMVAI